jgi:hypothetical protein
MDKEYITSMDALCNIGLETELPILLIRESIAPEIIKTTRSSIAHKEHTSNVADLIVLSTFSSETESRSMSVSEKLHRTTENNKIYSCAA